MKILHVLWGYSPWREGGLVQYADDLMEAQSDAGHDVAAFFPGRRGLWGGPALDKWRRGLIRNYEIRNAPLMHLGTRGTFPAAAELGEPRSEHFFRETLDDFNPQVVHIHELAGLPFTLVDIVKERKLSLIVTLHDYFPFCPALNLFSPQGKLCHDRSGGGCVVCCSKGGDGGFSDRLRTMKAAGYPKWLFAAPLLLRCGWDLLFSRRNSDLAPAPAEVYRERMCRNIERLRRVDIILAQSRRTMEIYAERTGRTDIKVTHSSLAYMEEILPRRKESITFPLRFATLNGTAAPHKGAGLMADTVEILRQRGYDGRYRLDIHGDMDRSVRSRLLSSASVRWHGRYRRSQLVEILDQADVGIIPSLCEEVYGYVGIEFLARGVPVIGNRRGGIVEYTLNGKTGWVNETCSAHELADIMEGIINAPESILPLNDWIINNRKAVIADRKEHLRFVLECYEKAMDTRRENL